MAETLKAVIEFTKLLDGGSEIASFRLESETRVPNTTGYCQIIFRRRDQHMPTQEHFSKLKSSIQCLAIYEAYLKDYKEPLSHLFLTSHVNYDLYFSSCDADEIRIGFQCALCREKNCLARVVVSHEGQIVHRTCLRKVSEQALQETTRLASVEMDLVQQML